MTTEKPKILIISNSKEDIVYLVSILQEIGCGIVTTPDASDALEKIKVVAPNLILIDLTSQISGYQLAQTLRKKSHKKKLIPILFLVPPSYHNGEFGKINEWAATDILRRPFYPFDTLARCRALLNLHRYENELEMAGQVIESLALAVEARDPTTGNHCDRLFFRLTKMADVLKLGIETKEVLLKGAVLHDIGKVGIPDNILLKEGPLTDREWEIMRCHVLIGESLCRPLKFLQPVLPLIRHHHERFDGSGYPDGLKGASIPLIARVFQVCDVFDALTNERPYKPAFPKEEAVSILTTETERGWWDPNLVDLFLQMIHQEV